MKRDMSKKSVIVLIILLIAILLITIIGATFAYFTLNVKYPESPKNTVIQSETLVVEFKSLNSIYYTDIIPGRPIFKEDEKQTNKMTFTLTSPVSGTFKTEYDIYLNIEENDFESDNLVFYLNDNYCLRNNNEGSKLGDLSTNKKIDYNYDGQDVKLGVIPAHTTGRFKIYDNAILGGKGCVDTYNFEIWLNEIGKAQNEDQEKSFKASIEVEAGNVYPLDYVFN